MNTIAIYQVDAFTDRLFSGNPAAVCILDQWMPDSLMQSIAAENNLAETAFALRTENYYEIRWFTPTVEVDLCGHATLAKAYVLFEQDHTSLEVLHFHSPRSVIPHKNFGCKGINKIEFQDCYFFKNAYVS